MANDPPGTVLDASFRDPSGFLFSQQGGTLLRQVNHAYSNHYEQCQSSGLYERLMAERLLIPHTEVDAPGVTTDRYRVIQPEVVPYVSYPYEWSFSQLKDAALLTLDLQTRCLDFEMTLKDASAYNVQFIAGRPIFIDSLSFEKYVEGTPWIAYRQFCQHFLAPLALMALRDVRSRQLLFRYLDGIPLDLASTLLPSSSYLKYSILAHLHLHARSQRRHQNDAIVGSPVKTPRISGSSFRALVSSLRAAIEGLELGEMDTEWGRYYEDTNYSDIAMQQKERIVATLVDTHLNDATIVHDLGANTGRFSRIAASEDRVAIAHDIDDMAVERHYRHIRGSGPNVLPLILDLGNPSPASGWDLRERSSFQERVRGGAVIALALVHHLCISNNVPIGRLARFFAGITDKLIIEFVPKEDSQVARLLATRSDVFQDYHAEAFEQTFSRYFHIVEKHDVEDSVRTIFYMKRIAEPQG